jgi:hypothetical protein
MFLSITLIFNWYNSDVLQTQGKVKLIAQMVQLVGFDEEDVVQLSSS